MFSMFGIILSLLLNILITRLLSVDMRGELQFYLTGAQAAALFGSFGIPFARALVEAKENIFLNKDSDLLLILPSVMIFLFIYISFYNISVDYINFCLIAVSFAIYTYAVDRTKNSKYLELYSKIYILNPIIMIGLFILLWRVPVDFSVANILFLYFISNIISSTIWYFRRKPKQNKTYKIKSTAIKVWLNNIFSYFANNTDKLIVFKVLSIYEVSIYFVLFSLSSVINKVFERISVNALSMFQRGSFDVKKLIRWLNVTIIILVPLVYFIICFFGDVTISFVFGEEYSGYSDVLFTIVVSSVLTSYSWMLAQRLLADLNILVNTIRTVGSSLVFVVSLLFFMSTQKVDILCVSLSYLLACIYRYISTIVLVFYYESVKE